MLAARFSGCRGWLAHMRPRRRCGRRGCVLRPGLVRRSFRHGRCVRRGRAGRPGGGLCRSGRWRRGRRERYCRGDRVRGLFLEPGARLQNHRCAGGSFTRCRRPGRGGLQNAAQPDPGADGRQHQYPTQPQPGLAPLWCALGRIAWPGAVDRFGRGRCWHGRRRYDRLRCDWLRCDRLRCGRLGRGRLGRGRLGCGRRRRGRLGHGRRRRDGLGCGRLGCDRLGCCRLGCCRLRYGRLRCGRLRCGRLRRDRLGGRARCAAVTAETCARRQRLSAVGAVGCRRGRRLSGAQRVAAAGAKPCAIRVVPQAGGTFNHGDLSASRVTHASFVI